MSDAVVVAIISGAVAIVSGLPALGWTIYTWRAERRKTSLEQTLSHVTAATKYTHTLDTIITTTRILNAEGDNETEVRVNGLRVSEGLSLNKIHMDLFTSGTFSAEAPPVLIETSRKGVCLDATLSTEQHYTCELGIYGGKQPDEAPLDYAYRFSAKKGYLLSRAAIKERFGSEALAYEYFEETIAVPVKHIRIAVSFPKDLMPNAFPIVTVAGLPQIAAAERARAEAAFKVSGNVAAINLDDPQPGLRYLVCWDGTPKISST